MSEEELLEAFKNEVCEKAKEVDPDSSQDWYSLSIGFFVAKGASPEVAHHLATTARYAYQYWTD